MNELKKLAFVLAIILGNINTSRAQNLDYFESPNNFFGTSGDLYLDDSHDLVRLKREGDDEIEIEVFMFDANDFPEGIPNTLDFEVLKDLASEYEDFDVDIDDIEYLKIFLRSGDDRVLTDPGIELRLAIWGDEGDDFIQGSDGDDFLVGGPGSDTLFGFGGGDTLIGGDNVANAHEDYCVDWLYGGPQADTFVQTKIHLFSQYRLTHSRNPRAAPSVTPLQTYVCLDKLADFQSWEDTINWQQAD